MIENVRRKAYGEFKYGVRVRRNKMCRTPCAVRRLAAYLDGRDESFGFEEIHDLADIDLDLRRRVTIKKKE